MRLAKLMLYFNTVKHLKFRQFVFNFIRRFSGKRKIANISDISCHSLILKNHITYKNKIDNESICFLNQKRNFEYIRDWTCKSEPKLWRYNLHYFDFLLDGGASEEIKDKLINDWIAISDSLNEDAWEPYPVSLRLVNWIKYFIEYKSNDIPSKWIASLGKQAVCLSNNIEYHILANHYFKNIKALFFAGSYLKCENSGKWFNQSKSALIAELEEQVLSDGGHYEKSPMYHCILIEDCLDLINLIETNSLDVSDSEVSCIKQQTTNALKWLDKMLMPDGNIPLFNDSAFGITPAPGELFEYAARITGFERQPGNMRYSVQSLEASGYYIVNALGSKCIIDCGSISPAYQPGHTHCDILSYELAINGRRVVVDTGLFDYENSPERHYSRSTQAHNTLVIDKREQSEIWGVFRVARRARITRAELTSDNNKQVFEGSYIPYWSNTNGISHTRNIEFSEGNWTFTDYVNGSGVHEITSYLHLHPDIELRQIDGMYYFLCDDVKLAKFRHSANAKFVSEDSYYYPEFGIKSKNKTIMLSAVCELPVTLQYVIEEL